MAELAASIHAKADRIGTARRAWPRKDTMIRMERKNSK